MTIIDECSYVSGPAGKGDSDSGACADMSPGVLAAARHAGLEEAWPMHDPSPRPCWSVGVDSSGGSSARVGNR
jgi:hypothetical protein